jgi:hypothetical protein
LLSPLGKPRARLLDIDLQKVDVLDLGNVIEPVSLQGGAIDHFPQMLEELKQAQRRRVRFESARHSGSATNVEYVRAAITHSIRQITLAGAVATLQLQQCMVLRLKPGHAA